MDHFNTLPLLSTKLLLSGEKRCLSSTALRLIVSYVISPSPAAVVHLEGGCVLFSE